MSFDGERILLRSAYGPSSGYGHDGLHLASALLDVGAEVHVEPTGVSVPLPMRNALLLTLPRPKKFDLVIQHADPETLFMPDPLADIARRSFAWTMWEFESLQGEDWEPSMLSRLNRFDDVFGYDATSALALQPYRPQGPVQIMQGGYDSSGWVPNPQKDPERDWDGVFRFVMLGQLGRRKNPFAAIKAFAELREEHGDDFDAELHLKTNYGGLPLAMQSAYSGLRIHFDAWTHEQVREFYAQAHCYVAPSWGEGKNIPALEAQTMGVPAIVSACGGHMQWADPSWNWIVDGTWEAHDPGGKPKQLSLRVDHEKLKAAMWEAYSNRGETKRRGELASRMIPAQCDWSVVVRSLSARLYG